MNASHIATVSNSFQQLFVQHAPGTSEFDQTLYEQSLNGMLSIFNQLMEQHDSIDEIVESDPTLLSLFDTKLLIPKLIMLLRLKYSQIRMLAVDCLTRIVQFHYGRSETVDRDQNLSSDIMSCVQILCDMCIMEEKATVRHSLARFMWNTTNFYTRSQRRRKQKEKTMNNEKRFVETEETRENGGSKDVHSEKNQIWIKCMVMALAFTQDLFDNVSQFAQEQFDGWILRGVMNDNDNQTVRQDCCQMVYDSCVSVMDRYHDSKLKGSIPLSHHALVMYVRALCTLWPTWEQMTLDNKSLTLPQNTTTRTDLLLKLNLIASIRDHALARALNVLYVRMNSGNVSFVQMVIQLLLRDPQSQLKDILSSENDRTCNVIESIDTGINSIITSSSNDTTATVLANGETLDNLVEIIATKCLVHSELSENETKRYKSLMQHLLSILNHCLIVRTSDHGNTVTPHISGQTINEALFICCIFCSERHCFSSEQTKELAQHILVKLSAGDDNIKNKLSKFVGFALRKLQPIFAASTADEVDPGWRAHPWAKYLLCWLIPQIPHPYLNGATLQALLPMVLKMANDFQEQEKLMGFQLLHHMLTECNRLQILAFDQYIFSVLKSSTAFRDNLELFDQIFRTVNLFIQLHLNYQLHSITANDNTTGPITIRESVTYGGPTSNFVEDMMNQYMTSAEYSNSDEQRLVILRNMLQFLSMMSLGMVKHTRRLVKILFSEDFLQNRRSDSVVDVALSLTQLLFSVAWPFINRVNNQERQHMIRVLGQVAEQLHDDRKDDRPQALLTILEQGQVQ